MASQILKRDPLFHGSNIGMFAPCIYLMAFSSNHFYLNREDIGYWVVSHTKGYMCIDKFLYLFFFSLLQMQNRCSKRKQLNGEKESQGARLRNIFYCLFPRNISALFTVYTCTHEFEPSVFNISNELHVWHFRFLAKSSSLKCFHVNQRRRSRMTRCDPDLYIWRCVSDIQTALFI